MLKIPFLLTKSQPAAEMEKVFLSALKREILSPLQQNEGALVRVSWTEPRQILNLSHLVGVK